MILVGSQPQNRGMQVRVLGPIEVCQAERVWSPGGPKERKLLAVLAVRLGEVVSVDAIADALWNGTPPRRAVKSVQMYVARLRAALDPTRTGAAVIHTVAPGYRLSVDRIDLDTNVFAYLVRQARETLERGETANAATFVGEAFALWRGAPYAEFTDSQYFVTEVRRLTETRLVALDVRLAAGLAQGRHAELVAEAESLCAEYPLREGFWVHLITALYRCGRQADALAACRRVRTLLSEEVGADPSAELRMLEQRVLRQDPTLAAPGRPGTASPPLPPELDPAGRLFVGRSDEIEWLRRRWSEVATGGYPLLLAIGGPPGSGRTRLLAEFAAELNAEGVAVHYGESGAGLVVLDDLDELTVAQLAVARAGQTLCVATYDTDHVNPTVRQAVQDAAAEWRLLPPLSREEVARVVENIAGAVDPNLVEEIAVASEGWPGPVERLTRAVVGERSAKLVAEAAAEAGPASRALTAARSGVAAGVRRLTRVRAWPADEPTESERLACPYKGLAAYELADAPLFHGREDLVASLCARLVDTAFVAVVGPSGAGKSSLVRAGVLAALADGVLPSFAGAPQWVLAPGSPLPAVGGPAVVVVDQFEEIFTRPVEGAVRDRYLDELTSLVQRDVRVVVVLRGDFVGACVVHPRLAQLIGDGTVLVGPMRPDEIRRAIELPARHVGLYAEAALSDAIVSDVEDRPGALPLLSTSLVEVWQRRSGATLTAAAYHQAGGVSAAVARLGEAAYASLDEPTREAARRLLLRLAETDESGSVVRRRVPRAELGDDPATGRALDVFVGRRLLTAGERGVEVAHESVLTYWPRLAAWLADDGHGRALRRHLAPAALDWINAEKPDTELYRGARLASALDWADERLEDLTVVERDFLAASREFADRALQEEIARADRLTRGRRRLRVALGAALGLLLLATATGVVAVDRWRAADQAARESLARRLGALALVTDDLDRSLLLAVEAVRAHSDWETRGALLAALGRRPQALRQVRGLNERGVMGQVALTRDGSTVVATGGAGKMFTWDAGTLMGTLEPDAIAMRTESVIPGPDARSVFISARVDGGDAEDFHAVIHWDPVDRRVLDDSYPLPKGVIGSANRLALSDNRRSLAVPTNGPLLLLYEVGTGRRADVPLPETPADVWPAGSLVVTAAENGDTAYFVDPSAARIVRTLPLPFPGNVTASPSGRELLIVSGARVVLVDADSGHTIGNFSGASRSADVAAFSGDGALVAVGSKDKSIEVFDVRTGDIRDTLKGHAAPISALVFGADGKTLYSTSEDNSIIEWDVAGDRSFGARHNRVPVLPPARPSACALDATCPPAVGWSADRTRVYVDAAFGGGAALIEAQTGAAELVTPIAFGYGALFPHLDENAVILTTSDGSVERRDLLSAAVTGTIPPAKSPLRRDAVGISGDGRRIAIALTNDDPSPFRATSDDRPNVEIYDADTLGPSTSIGPLQFPLWSAWLNTNGSLLLTSSANPSRWVELWDTQTGRRRWATDIELPFLVGAVAWSPDGDTLVAGNVRGAVVILDLSTGEILEKYVQQVASGISSIALSPNGEIIAFSGDDAQVHLLAAAGLREIGTLPVPTGPEWTFVSFDSDGAMLSAVDERGNVIRWNTDPQDWIKRACSIVGRDFFPGEWETYLPGVAYERTCPAFG